MKKRAPRRKQSESGMATLEALPLMIVFVVLVAYMLGAFGIIHTGILHSIAARTYAFETFRHRTKLVYMRDAPATGEPLHFKRHGSRLHAILSERHSGYSTFYPSERLIAMGLTAPLASHQAEDVHNEKLYAEVLPQVQNNRVDVNPVWIKVQYGICLDARCGE